MTKADYVTELVREEGARFKEGLTAVEVAAEQLVRRGGFLPVERAAAQVAIKQEVSLGLLGSGIDEKALAGLGFEWLIRTGFIELGDNFLYHATSKLAEDPEGFQPPSL